MKALLLGFAIVGFFGNQSRANVPVFLKHWGTDPKKAALEIPAKKGFLNSVPIFKRQADKSNFISLKNKTRLALCAKSGQVGCSELMHTWAHFNEHYYLEKFVGGPIDSNIYSLDAYKRGQASITPWSGSYWPQFRGGIGVRYADANFPDSENFLDNFAYYEKNYHHNPQSIADLNELSPAEKYDLLFQDYDWLLTKSSWAEPAYTHQLNGKVETWTGICHGWSAAAVSVPEPRRSFDIYVPSVNRNVRFYPDDVKALASQLWASTPVNAVFLGGRCNVPEPSIDANGRVTDPECFDTNPASWHLALVNLMGKHQKSFVFDVIYDYEVWNQPVASYTINYFNPSSLNITNNINESLVPYGNLQKDPFYAYRSPYTQFLLGIEVALNYVVENEPQPISGIDHQQPSIVQIKYYYDLELDLNFNIIGGEWYQVSHPDMLWRPTVSSPIASSEPLNSYWNGFLPMTFELLTPGYEASKITQPLGAIVNRLIEFSKL